jgi:hypothetical protein
MRIDILTPTQLEALERLKLVPELRSFYLAGGTALALHLGHRRSEDFDLFLDGALDPEALRRSLEEHVVGTRFRSQAVMTLYVEVGGVITSFFGLRRPLVDSPGATPWGFSIAGVDDIAAMKLEAIASRGSRKDFVDLFFICRDRALRTVFELHAARYQGASHDPYHRLRALTYFDDAEAEPMPAMLAPLDWDELKRFFVDEAAALWASGEPLR